MNYSLAVGPRIIIFTDMDGTLLDHHSYAWDEAKPALELAQQHQIPVIPCTSKTASETQTLVKEIGLDEIIVSENGGGYLLDGALTALGATVNKLTGDLAAIREKYRFHFKGMSEMTLSEVVDLTGLPEEKAEDARHRKFSEPFIWHEESDDRFAQFVLAANQRAIDIVQGGRFYHAMSQGVSKGKAMREVTRKLLGENFAKYVKIIALGDSDNDISMLGEADIGIVINNPTRSFPEVASPNGNLHYTSEFGPKGWNSAIIKILESHYG